MSESDEPTILTFKDIENFLDRIEKGEFDVKEKDCWNCGKKYLMSYGASLCECDECYFSRFPKDQVEQFYKSFFN
jgi:hypothetical protein